MDIILHVGVHKTASTYIQRRVSANCDLLAAHGVTFVSPATYRPALAKAWSRTRLFSNVPRIRQRRQARLFADMLQEAENAGHRRFILSEENIVGPLDPVLTGTWFFDQAAGRVEALLRCLPTAPKQVLIAIRSYAGFFPSAYAEALKMKGFVPFDDDLKQRYLTLDRGWPELISEIAEVLPPETRLSAWQHEAFPGIEQQIMEQLVGHAPAQQLEPLIKRQQEGPTDRAMNHLHSLAARGKSLNCQRIRQVMRATSKSDGLAGFDPWTDDEHRILAHRYKHDLGRISQNWPDLLLHPPVDQGVSGKTPSTLQTPPPDARELSLNAD